MRRNRDKALKRRKFYLSIFIVITMVFSTFGFIASFHSQPQDQDFSYNGFEFEANQNEWLTQVDTPFGLQEFSFYFHPLDIVTQMPQEIPLAIEQSPTITLVFEPNSTNVQYIELSRFTLTQHLIAFLGKNIQNTLVHNKTRNDYNFPVESCQPEQGNVYITYVDSNKTQISMNQNCITMEASNPTDYIRFTEQIIYHLLGVMP